MLQNIVFTYKNTCKTPATAISAPLVLPGFVPIML